jgi:hypothetical protein
MPVKAARSEVTIVMILPPSWTVFALSCRIRNAALELTLNEWSDLFRAQRQETGVRDYLRKHGIVLSLRDIGHRLLQHHPNCIDDDVQLAVFCHGVFEELRDGCACGQVAGVD